MLSTYFSRRDANRGGCSQSCRWSYDIYDSGILKTLESDTPFSMSSKDMCLVNHIGELIELGIDSFKIEGRMKSLHYIATVVSSYRKLIDAYCENPDSFSYEGYLQELEKAANRAFCTGFYNGDPQNNAQLFNLRDEHPTQEFVMRILDYDKDQQIMKVEQRNYFKKGDRIEIFSPSHNNYLFTIEKIINEENIEVETANHPMEILYIPLNKEVYKDDMGRKVRDE